MVRPVLIGFTIHMCVLEFSLSCIYIDHTELFLLVTFLVSHHLFIKYKQQTPLHWAAINGHSDVAHVLINSNADTECKDEVS